MRRWFWVALQIAVVALLMRLAHHIEGAQQVRKVAEIMVDSPVTAARLDVTGRYFACAWLGRVGVFDVRSGKQVSPELAAPRGVFDLAFSRDGKFVYARSWAGLVQYETRSWKMVFQVREPLAAADMSDSGEVIMTGENIARGGRCEDYFLTAYRSGEKFFSEHGDDVCINQLRLNARGDRYLSQWRDRGAILGWGLGSFDGHGRYIGTGGARFSQDGESIAYWNAKDKTLAVLDGRTLARRAGPVESGGVQPGQFSLDDKFVLTTGSGADDKGLAQIWTSALVLVCQLRSTSDYLYSQWITGDRVVSFDESGQLVVWDARTGRPVGEAFRGVDTLSDVDTSPAGLIVTAGADRAAPKKGVVRVWRL